VFQIRLHKCRI